MQNTCLILYSILTPQIKLRFTGDAPHFQSAVSEYYSQILYLPCLKPVTSLQIYTSLWTGFPITLVIACSAPLFLHV